MRKIGLSVGTLGLWVVGIFGQQMAGDRGETTLTLDGGKVTVEYGRPVLAGRDVKAMLQPGMEWRMGSNSATTLTTDVSLKFGNKSVPKGKYVLKAKFVEEGKWLLLIQQDEKTIAEVPLTVGNNAKSVEQVTISLEKQGVGGKLTVAWGTLNVSTPFQKA
jgi:hypothetical protein